MKEITLLSNPILTTPAIKIKASELNSAEIETIKKELLDKMAENDVPGIAATQIGIDLCMIAFGFNKRERFPDEKPVPLTVLVNPQFKPISDEKISPPVWEHCLSILGMTGATNRYRGCKRKPSKFPV